MQDIYGNTALFLALMGPENEVYSAIVRLLLDAGKYKTGCNKSTPHRPSLLLTLVFGYLHCL